MGSNQSVQTLEDEEDEEEDEDEEEEDENGGHGPRDPDGVVKKVLEQEPEMLPCYASASPLSPQLSSLGTPRMGPSIKVWDPYNVLAPPPPLPPPPVSFGRSYSSEGMMVVVEEEKGNIMEVYLISHGESEMSLRPDLISGRCPDEGLTPNGKRQARALAVFLNSQGVRFNAVYSSPLDRAKATAASVCQRLQKQGREVHKKAKEQNRDKYVHYKAKTTQAANIPSGDQSMIHQQKIQQPQGREEHHSIPKER